MENKLGTTEIKNAFQQIMDELNNRPWYEKWWSGFKVFKWAMWCHVRHAFFGLPINIDAKNEVARHIKDDIEFGYTLEMIYGKIMSGSYGNERIPEKHDWFKKHNIDWNEIPNRPLNKNKERD